MRKTLTFTFLYILLITSRIFAQQTYPVTDKQPANINGLEMGYVIKSQEVKTVGNKGDFSRYSVSFYITNTTTESKIILYKQGLNIFNNVSDQLVLFKCLNATGARLTSNQVTLSAPPCSLLADVEDRDASNKVVKNRRFVQVGYWIKSGQTIKADVILIVPLNELPNVEATYLAAQLQPVASVYSGPQPVPPSQPNVQGFVKFRNSYTNTYLNIQTGVPASSPIDAGWWSAQWQLVPISGTNYYNIKNRWKGTYLTSDMNGLGMFVDYMSDGSRWVLEPLRDGNVYHIRNLSSGGYLCIASNQLKLAKNFANVMTSEWTMEQP